MTNFDSIQDSTRYVVSNLHRGSILPGTRLEMARDVYLESGADVRGGVWCGSLSVLGPKVDVADAVYCNGSASIEPSDSGTMDGTVTFGSCFSASESLSVEPSPIKIRFLSDIYTNQLNISNAFVYGNIYANRAVIRNSIVLGGVYCDSSLTMERSLVSTFHTGRAVIGKGSGLFLPYAVARESIDLQDPARMLTFYTLYRQSGEVGDTVLLDEDDILTITLDEDSNNVRSRNARQVYCLSVMERVLDSEPLGKHLLFNKRFMEQLALHRNLSPEVRSRHIERPLDGLELALWDVLSGNDTSSGQRAGRSIQEIFDVLSGGRVA